MSEGPAGGEVAAAEVPSRLRAFVVALASVVNAALFTAILWPLLQPAGTPLFFAAVAVSSWYGGLGPGLFATVIAAAVSEWFFVAPGPGVTLALLVRCASFVVVALLVASLYQRARRAQHQAEALARAREWLLRDEQAARAAAETASRAKDEFLATLSHELRTPLNALVGWTWWLRRGDLDPDRRDRALETIERNAKSVAQLIEDLLDVSRIVTGKLRLVVRPLDVAAVVEAAVAAVQPAATAKSIELLVVVDAVATLRGDPDRLQQVIWNLLSNAIKFTPDKGTVTVRVDATDEALRITVRDSGHGIAPDLLPHVFTRFTQGGGRRGGGLGLGLAIARHLVELHGGAITADSEGEGRGATFTVSLPRGSGTEAAPPVRVGDAAPGVPRLDGVRVLVVDDDASAREWCALTLSRFGAIVHTAVAAREALELIEREPPHVLVSDLRLVGDEDGYDLIRRVRASDAARGRRLPAVALTAYPRVEDRARALDAGYHVHVPKPAEPHELVCVIASLAGRGTGN
jgi:signal transduction histidine kinase